jgi:hypothetical protein
MYFLSFYRIIFRRKFFRDVIHWKYFKCTDDEKNNKTPRFCEPERSALSFRKKILYSRSKRRMVLWRSVHLRNGKATIRPTPSVLPKIRPLWKCVPVILLYLYDLSWYFSSTPGLWWTCHTEHDVHRVLLNLYVLSHLRHLNN